MDAVPGLPTYFVFTPVKTTAEYRNELRKYDEYNTPADETDPTGPKRWEKFDYELACAELCGKGHYSMKRIFRVVTQEEFDAWYKTQESFYLSQMREKDEDPIRRKCSISKWASARKSLEITLKRLLNLPMLRTKHFRTATHQFRVWFCCTNCG
ncbi:MAG: hypothetical protein IPH31_13350 [Lewinellaceae bacterium]|nr:hypothetical protein [Lewinellaceae bacterium]